MSEYTDFIRWQAGCLDTTSYGSTPGDTFHRGLRNYSQLHPCPNGLPILNTLPSESWVHRERIKNARKFIEEHSREIRVRESAEIIKPKQIEEDIKEIKAWLISLFTAQSGIGSHASKQVAAN